MAMISRTSSRGAKARFVKSRGGASVRVAKNGGTRIGPTHCRASGKHFPLGYGKGSAY